MYYLKQLRYFLRLRWVPGVVVVTTVGLITWAVWRHQYVLERDPNFSFDELLTAMAGVLTSIVVTTFSAVFVALTLASAQFSPRIVRGFFREDWRVQLVLVMYVLVIAHCFVIKLLGLTGMDDTFQVGKMVFHYAETALVPGILLILLVFPYFVYYIIRNINAAKITKTIAERTIREIESHFREEWTWMDEDTYLTPEPPDTSSRLCVYANDRGYLDHFNTSTLWLVKWLGHPVYIRKYVGSFISKGGLVAIVDYTGKNKLKRLILEWLVQSSIVVKEYRSYTQDINFGIRQLVDIAIKAISPAINDPTTAVTCINYLGEIVKEFAQHRVPSRNTKQLDAIGVHINEYSFEKVVDQAFNQIHQWGRTDPIIVRQIIHVLTEVIPTTKNPHNLLILIKEVEDLELLEKSPEELKELFLYWEYVQSIRQNYLRRFLKTAIKSMDAVIVEVGKLPESAQKLHAESLAEMAIVKARLGQYLQNFQI